MAGSSANKETSVPGPILGARSGAGSLGTLHTPATLCDLGGESGTLLCPQDACWDLERFHPTVTATLQRLLCLEHPGGTKLTLWLVALRLLGTQCSLPGPSPGRLQTEPAAVHTGSPGPRGQSCPLPTGKLRAELDVLVVALTAMWGIWRGARAMRDCGTPSRATCGPFPTPHNEML